jgi:GH25 family lysozyme M1 (1,4-beta-N-acetylmuramidase)
MRRPHLARILLAIALGVVAVPLSGPGEATAAARGNFQAECTARVRTRPTTASGTAAMIPVGTVVRVTGAVTGGGYAATCARSVSGTTWYVVTAVGGRTTTALYGLAQVYIASRLVRIAPSPYLEGIDVSSWQPSIDFDAVRRSGRSFVYAKASEGRYWSDADYAGFRAGAAAAGLAFGAYHFARPDRTAGDAVLEADHFIAAARPRRGDLRPVVDIESSGGLSPSALRTWIAAYAGRIWTRLGVRVVIYTTPGVWADLTADTTWFAANGYRRVWTASWDTTVPAVPARDWAGFHWAIWQYSDCGDVPGVRGCVDLDRIRDSDLSALLT